MMDALLNASSAVGADLPVRIKRAMAAGAHVANLGVAHGGETHKVLLDGRVRTAGRCRTGQVGARAGPCPAHYSSRSAA